MLGKLIKHDFKSLSKILFPTQIAILGASVLGTIGFAFNFRTDSYSDAAGVGLIRIITTLMSGIMILAIIAASFLVAFIIFQRFYKNLMCDEGYLTFTLPVTVDNILWSKLITAVLWTIISTVVIFVGINIFILFGSGSNVFVNLEPYRQLSMIINEAFKTIGTRLIWPVLEVVLFIILGTVSQILQVYLSLIIGGIVSQKHKILASIGFYFVINIAVSIITSVITSILQFASANSIVNWGESIEDSINAHNVVEIYNLLVTGVQPYFWIYFGITAAISAGYFILSRYFLKNKLNLE